MMQLKILVPRSGLVEWDVVFPARYTACEVCLEHRESIVVTARTVFKHIRSCQGRPP